MTKLLYSQSTQVIKPYPRLDDAPIAGLDPGYLVLDKVEVAPISYDPETQIATTHWVVDLEALEYRQEWIITDKPIPEPTPNWDGLYQGLMVSSVYPTLVGIGQQISGVDGALDKTIDAIQYGIFKPDSVAALPAFQSAINLLLTVLTGAGQVLTTEQTAETRAILDANNFQSITLQ